MDNSQKEYLATQYTTQELIDADNDLFLHAFEDYDGVFTPRKEDMTPRQLAEAITTEQATILHRYLGVYTAN